MAQGKNVVVLQVGKGVIEPIPSAEMKSGFFSPYFIVPKKGGGLTPILDLRILNLALHKLPHRLFLRFAFEGQAYQYKALPCGLSLSHRVFKKIAEAALSPLSEGCSSQPPGSIGTLGQLRKEQTLPSAEYLFIQCRTGLGHYDCTSFLRPCIVSAEVRVPLEQVSRCIVVTTDASTTGWGTICNGHAALGIWTGPRLLWHINCLELLTVLLALKRFRPLVQGKHVLVRTDDTATVAYINHQGGSQHRLKSLCATHILGELNRVTDSISLQVALRGEWRLHTQTVQLIWSRFGQAQVDLFASLKSTHCQLWYGLTCTLSTDALAHSWLKGLRKYAFPPVSLIAQTLCKVREDEEQIVLVDLFWSKRTWFSELMLLSSIPPWHISLRKDLISQGKGTIWHQISGTSIYGKDPWRCGIKSVLSFLHGGLDRHLSASTPKIHVAVISANHDLTAFFKIRSPTGLWTQSKWPTRPEVYPAHSESQPLDQGHPCLSCLGSKCGAGADGVGADASGTIIKHISKEAGATVLTVFTGNTVSQIQPLWLPPITTRGNRPWTISFNLDSITHNTVSGADHRHRCQPLPTDYK
ncbi:enzymatic polyprotein [Labeo rohita]|uniref:Enzymatic polyprotein n=1 Tax=Labeo rohita TaxID=84645 RepID=A0ABQ8L2D6_LABRO|nr:enzymatic polyprotein [Labeo rohita]